MGLFRRDPPPVPLPIPRETRVWPQARPAAAPARAVAPIPAAPPPPAAVVRKAEVPAPAAKEAASVSAAFAHWKQVTAQRTAVAGKAEAATALADASSGSVPKVEGRREDPVMYVYRAAVKQARGEHDAAIEDLTKAIEIDPACTTAWAGRALSLEAKGDLAGARRDYAKSIEIELRQEIARHARPL